MPENPEASANDVPPEDSVSAPLESEPEASADEVFSEPETFVEEQLAEEQPAEEADLQEQLQDAEGRYLRAQAELDNYRKQVSRRMEEDRRYAPANLLRDLLPVLDNMQRAIASAEQNENSAGLLEGVQMVAQQFAVVLQQHHCLQIEAAGQPFDPHFHEAIAQQPSQDQPPGTVLDVAQQGYRLHDRVLRPAQVLVSQAPAD